jgi:hypothetical protein
VLFMHCIEKRFNHFLRRSHLRWFVPGPSNGLVVASQGF